MLKIAPAAPVVAHTPQPGVPPELAWMSTRHLQRAVVYMKAVGLDWAGVLAAGGLAEHQLDDGDRPIPLPALEAVLEVLDAQARDPLLGLHMVREIQPGTLGALGLLLQSCATLADLLDVVERFNGLMSNIGWTSSVRLPGRFEVRWECRAGTELLRRTGGQYIMGSLAVLSRLLVPGIDRPLAVGFAHACPVGPERVREYFDFFGCPVYFDQPVNFLLAPTEHLHLRLPHGNAVVKDMLERHAQWLLEQRQQPHAIVDDVRRLLRNLVLAGRPSKEAVAEQLGLSARSLHRRLTESGLGYATLLDEVRMDLARAQLEGTDAPLADVAERLGFSTPQAFMRWFRAQCGQTPGQFRERQAVSGC